MIEDSKFHEATLGNVVDEENETVCFAPCRCNCGDDCQAQVNSDPEVNAMTGGEVSKIMVQ